MKARIALVASGPWVIAVAVECGALSYSVRAKDAGSPRQGQQGIRQQHSGERALTKNPPARKRGGWRPGALAHWFAVRLVRTAGGSKWP